MCGFVFHICSIFFSKCYISRCSVHRAVLFLQYSMLLISALIRQTSCSLQWFCRPEREEVVYLGAQKGGDGDHGQRWRDRARTGNVDAV